MSTETPEIVTLTVDADQTGQRLDQFLAKQLTGYSRTQLHRQIGEGDVLVNEQRAKASYKVRAGDSVEVELPTPPITSLIPEAIPLNIVYEDAELLVVNKPAGLVVHPAAGIERGTLANGLVAYLGAFSAAGEPLRPGIVHRLDKDTSGLLVVAKTEPAYQSLTEQFAARTVTKRYIALVYGKLKSGSGVIDLPIGRHKTQRTKMAIAPGRGRPAYTSYHCRAQTTEFALLDVEIKTGRTHQIRVHLTHIHHPVVGDEVYGTNRAANLQSAIARRAIAALNRNFLHAAHLAFTHPTTNQRMEFDAPLPAELRQLLTIIGVDSQ